MAQWQSKLDLTDVWNKVDDNEITIAELSKIVAERLSQIEPYPSLDIIPERDDIVEAFELLAGDDETTIEEFDWIMNDLYNWADISLDGKFGGKKVCWVATNF